MQLPGIWLPRPSLEPTDDDAAAFDRLCELIEADSACTAIDFRLDVPKWLFLEYLVKTGRYLLHGSSDPGIREFVPRVSDDVREFGRQRAVYAAADGIWPLFYATVDRAKAGTIVNSCATVDSAADGSAPTRTWYFSVDARGLAASPWRAGTVYVLPVETFVADGPIVRGSVTATPLQSASTVRVRPSATLAVEPGDFPFLDAVRGHDERILAAAAAADPDGFPWPQATGVGAL